LKPSLTQGQTAVLRYIESNPGCTNAEGAAWLQISMPSFRRIAEGLYAHDLISRQMALVRAASHRWWPGDVEAHTLSRIWAVAGDTTAG
jgi:hypothetical protein